MKFGQLIKYNMRGIFLEKSYTKCGEETSPRPIYKKSKLNISGSRVLNIIKFLFTVCPSRRLPKYIKTKMLTICFYLI